MSRYTKALGLDDSEHRVNTALSVSGVMEWGISKAPALLGGKLADMAYTAVNKRFPNHKWGVDAVGSVGVIVVAYGLQFGGSRFMPKYTHLLDKVTDGMAGRMSPAISNTIKRMVGMSPAQGTGTDSLSVDGDRDAMKELGSLLYASPETTGSLADEMFALMKADGVEVNAEGKTAIARNMRTAAQKLAQGRF